MQQLKSSILFFPKNIPGTLGVRPLSQAGWDQGSTTGVPLFNPEGTRGVENRKHHDTDIGEDGNPHVGNSDCAE